SSQWYIELRTDSSSTSGSGSGSGSGGNAAGTGHRLNMSLWNSISLCSYHSHVRHELASRVVLLRNDNHNDDDDNDCAFNAHSQPKPIHENQHDIHPHSHSHGDADAHSSSVAVADSWYDLPTDGRETELELSNALRHMRVTASTSAPAHEHHDNA